jgi:hypothetical protein
LLHCSIIAIFKLLGDGRFEKITHISIHALESGRSIPISKLVASFFAARSAARASAAAIEFNRRPADEDLLVLGIDPKAFASVRLI